MKTFIPPEHKHQGIEITPLIDVVFILLLFFVLTSSFSDPALPLDLPESESSGRPELPDIQIAIDPGGAVYLNGKASDLEDLRSLINGFAVSGKKPSVSLQADQETAYREVFSVIDLLKSMEITELQLVHSEKQ
jgi:biopolymer transport protein ExbD